MSLHPHRLYSLILLLALGPLLLPVANATEPERRGPMVIYSAEAGFGDVKTALMSSITEQGIVISNVLHASRMLNRTGPDLGITENVYLNAQTFEFCKSSLSHTLVAADPANMMACPYAIGIYQLSRQPDTIHLAYRKPQGVPGSEQVTEQIEKLLQQIIADTLDFL